MAQIIKRRGQAEGFDPKKIQNTCLRACSNAHLDEAQASQLCDKVVDAIEDWRRSREGITSDDIFKKVTKLMALQNEAAAFMFETHRDIR